MANRDQITNEQRIVDCRGPSNRTDVGNPQMGADGKDICLQVTSNDKGVKCVESLSDSGTRKIYNNGTVEIVSGVNGVEGGIDFKISGMNGDITITCMKNGAVRIRGANIMIQADEDVDITAGRNLTMNSKSGRILLNGNKADVIALAGNLAEATSGSFVQRVFTSPKAIEEVKNSVLGNDFLQKAGAITAIGAVAGVVGNVTGDLLFGGKEEINPSNKNRPKKTGIGTTS